MRSFDRSLSITVVALATLGSAGCLAGSLGPEAADQDETSSESNDDSLSEGDGATGSEMPSGPSESTPSLASGSVRNVPQLPGDHSQCAGTLPAGAPPVPELALWAEQMKTYGDQHCGRLLDPSVDYGEKFASGYYDQTRVFFQIADYTGDTHWLECAAQAQYWYRDSYVLREDVRGHVPGYQIFPDGIAMEWYRDKNQASQTALSLLAINPSFAAGEYPDSLKTTALSREVAYNLRTKLIAQDVAGYTDEALLKTFVSYVKGHFDQWFVAQTSEYVRPFMVALSAEALITWHSRTCDAEVVTALQRAADYLWDKAWLPEHEAFAYTDRIAPDGSGDMSAAADLNLLIAPMFAWLYRQTGDPRYQERGDAVFAGGVRQGPGSLLYAKQYNQQYRWSFDYVRWRTQSDPQP